MRTTGSPGVQLPELHEALVRWLATHSADPHPEPEQFAAQALFPAEGEAECG
jgi:hypothetical protein